MRKKILIIYATILILGASYTAIIFLTGWGMPCYFHEITGLQCPGCGTSRMALSIMKLDLKSAFAYNPVAFIAFPAWFVISVLAFIGKPAIFRKKEVLLKCLYVTIGAYMVLFIMRLFGLC